MKLIVILQEGNHNQNLTDHNVSLERLRLSDVPISRLRLLADDPKYEKNAY